MLKHPAFRSAFASSTECLNGPPPHSSLVAIRSTTNTTAYVVSLLFFCSINLRDCSQCHPVPFRLSRTSSRLPARLHTLPLLATPTVSSSFFTVRFLPNPHHDSSRYGRPPHWGAERQSLKYIQQLGIRICMLDQILLIDSSPRPFVRR